MAKRKWNRFLERWLPKLRVYSWCSVGANDAHYSGQCCVFEWIGPRIVIQISFGRSEKPNGKA